MHFNRSQIGSHLPFGILPTAKGPRIVNPSCPNKSSVYTPHGHPQLTTTPGFGEDPLAFTSSQKRLQAMKFLNCNPVLLAVTGTVQIRLMSIFAASRNCEK